MSAPEEVAALADLLRRQRGHSRQRQMTVEQQAGAILAQLSRPADAHAGSDVVARLDSFATLEKGWDSYGGAPITPEAIATARIILTGEPFPVPTSDGGVALEWQAGQQDVTVRIFPDGDTEAQAAAIAEKAIADKAVERWRELGEKAVGYMRHDPGCPDEKGKCWCEFEEIRDQLLAESQP